MNGGNEISPENMILKAGDIIIYNATKGGLFSSLQRFFTRMDFTHTSVVFNRIIGLDSVIEANETVAITPFQRTLADTATEFWVFRIKDVSDDLKQEALQYIYNKLSGKLYGFLQLLYFVRRWIWETKWFKFLFGWIPRFLGKPDDVRIWNNWFVKGTICSELKWHYDYFIAERIEDNDWLNTLKEWNSNNFHSGDACIVCERVPKIILKYERKFVDKQLKLIAY